MNINRLFSTKERIDILKNVIYSEKELGVIETSKKVNLSKGLVSKYFEILLDENILRRKGTKFTIVDNNLTKGIRIMLNLQNMETILFKNYKFVRAVGLYGSCSKGTNKVDSDVDLWIKTDKVSDEELSHLTAFLRKKIENIKILILTDEKIKHLKEKDPLFYHALHFGSIILYGEEYEI